MKKIKKNKHTIIPLQETNFDMIRNMDDTELAFFIVHQTGCDRCDKFDENKNKNCSISECSSYWLKWGQSPSQPIDLNNL